MPRAGFEPAIPMFERLKTVLPLDLAAIETGQVILPSVQNNFCTNLQKYHHSHILVRDFLDHNPSQIHYCPYIIPSYFRSYTFFTETLFFSDILLFLS
jgi:hypothetical protein